MCRGNAFVAYVQPLLQLFCAGTDFPRSGKEGKIRRGLLQSSPDWRPRPAREAGRICCRDTVPLQEKPCPPKATTGARSSSAAMGPQSKVADMTKDFQTEFRNSPRSINKQSAKARSG